MRRFQTLFLAAAVLMTPAIAFAQAAPPQPTLTRTAPVWIGFLFMFLLTAVVLAVSLMPSKRSHQD